jgi:hypothetical protein
MVEARVERHTSKDPKSNLTCTPKRDRDIDVEDPLSLRRKRNKTKTHPTTSCNTSATERYICLMYFFLSLAHFYYLF